MARGDSALPHARGRERQLGLRLACASERDARPSDCRQFRTVITVDVRTVNHWALYARTMDARTIDLRTMDFGTSRSIGANTRGRRGRERTARGRSRERKTMEAHNVMLGTTRFLGAAMTAGLFLLGAEHAS